MTEQSTAQRMCRCGHSKVQHTHSERAGDAGLCTYGGAGGCSCVGFEEVQAPYETCTDCGHGKIHHEPHCEPVEGDHSGRCTVGPCGCTGYAEDADHSEDYTASGLLLGTQTMKVRIDPTRYMCRAVNHPRHFCSHPSGVECIEIVEHYPYNEGNAIKYLWRAGLKGPKLEDLEKAAWYVARAIEKCKKDEERVSEISRKSS